MLLAVYIGTLLKKYFYPHRGNGQHPHFLRAQAVVGMLAVVFVAELFFLSGMYSGAYRTNMFAAVFSNVLVDETNTERASDNLPTLRVNPVLEAAARLKADDMAQNGYFAHVSPSGTTPWHWFDEAGYSYTRAGENLAVNFVDSADVVAAWMNSPKHRENIMNQYYEETGIATARGTYKGKDTIFIVQLFGTPRAEAAASAPIPKPIVTALPAHTPQLAVPPAVFATSSPTSSPIVAGAENQVTQAPLDSEPVSSPTSPAPQYSSFIERLVTGPHRVTNLLYMTLFTLVLLCFAFVVAVRMGMPHPHLVLNSFVFLLIVGSVILANHYIATAAADVL